MGNFYTNVTLRGPDQQQAVAAVVALGYRAYVAPAAGDLTVVCEERSDKQDLVVWHKVARELSAKLSCPALAALNHDDDILCLALYRDGALLDDYNSFPSYWSDEEPAPPSGGDAAALCAAFGMPGKPGEVERILCQAEDEESDEPVFVFAFQRHAAILKALDWPEIEYQQGFDSLRHGHGLAGWRLVEQAS